MITENREWSVKSKTRVNPTTSIIILYINTPHIPISGRDLSEWIQDVK